MKKWWQRRPLEELPPEAGGPRGGSLRPPPSPPHPPADSATSSNQTAMPPWPIAALLLAAVPTLIFARRKKPASPRDRTVPQTLSQSSFLRAADVLGTAASPGPGPGPAPLPAPPRPGMDGSTPPPAPELPSRFREVTFIAGGGMGVVFRARDRDLERTVAIKTLAPHLARDAAAVDRFFRESRAMARLTHPAIVAVHDVARSPVPYIVMEYLEGKTLRMLLAGHELPFRQRLAVGLAVTRALAYAHSGGVVHRDVKPENVIVTHDGRTKLLDFGLARLTDAGTGQANSLVNMHSAYSGSERYLAPELARGLPASPRTDAFALGRVLTEMLAMAGPDGAAPPLSPALSEALAGITALDAERRSEDLAEVMGALEGEIARQTAPAAGADAAAFRSVIGALEEAYSRVLHGLKASLGVYRRCEGDPESVFTFLLNPEGVAEVAARVDELMAGPVATLAARGTSGVADVDALAGDVAGYDWLGLKRNLARLATVTGDARIAAVERLGELHVSVAQLSGRVAALLDAHRAKLAPAVEAAVRGIAGRERVALDLDPEAALVVPASERLAADVREMVSNLVNNALEARARAVRVGLRAQGRGVDLAVADDGAGIAPERLPGLFEAGVTTKTNGSGTGLARVKQLAALYGGQARVESRPGAGTTFTVTFPGA